MRYRFAALVAALVLPACSAFTPAHVADALAPLAQACQAGLVTHPAVVAQAEALGLPNAAALAEYLCAVPDVVNEFRNRDSNVANRAVCVAIEMGALP